MLNEKILLAIILCGFVKEGNLETTKKILESIAYDFKNLWDYDFRTPLHIAA